MIQFTKVIVTRAELMLMFSLENVFITRWSGKQATAAYADAARNKRPGIPPMPRLEGLGKGARYHLPTVEAWLLKYFQKGGEEMEPKRR